MARTDRFKGLLTRGAAFGGLLIAYIRFFPIQIAEILNAPLYVGYQISLLFALSIGLLMGVYYISSVIKDEADRLEENITSEEIRKMLEETAEEGEEMLEETTEEDEEMSTDGGQVISDGGGKDERKPLFQKPDSLIDRFIIEPSGRGALSGIIIGVFLGFLFGPNGIIIGGIVGGIIGNEVEYQAIREKRKSVLGLETEATQEGSLSTDLIYDLLRYRRIRLALEVLFEERELSLSELAERIAALENEKPITELSATERKRVYTALYQTHLPRLQKPEIINWDTSTGVVSLGEKSEEIKTYIQRDRSKLDISQDKIYDTLKNRRRRLSLQILLDEDRPMELSELAERLAALENEKSITELSAPERKAVYTALYQTHLPKLVDAGFIEYNQKKGIVELEEQVKNLKSPTFRIPARRFSWNLYYAILSIVFLTILITREAEIITYSEAKLSILFVIYSSLIAIPALYELAMSGRE